jgi:formate C-acetyltransferase
VLKSGLLAIRERSDEHSKRSIDALLSLCEKYRLYALSIGREDIAKTLERVPMYSPTSFREALQFVRILNYALFLEGNYHNTLGRFDRYLYPYLENDLKSGKENSESALSLVEEFFLSLNIDSELYPGIQQGDDGQSLMLGGVDGGFNTLSYLAIKASGNLLVIDPKINVRVDKNTPEEIYTLCSDLTKKGLGFPQYSNDDIVIDALTTLGYEKKDAENYTVAACWEFIIPAVGEDIPNVGALNLPKAVDTCLRRDLASSKSYGDFLSCVKKEIFTMCDSICDKIKSVWFVPSPLLESLMGYEKGNPKYVNYGLHGVGISDAADSLAAIKEHIFDKNMPAERLIKAVENDFEGEAELLHSLRYESEKLGASSDSADSALVFLIESFSEALRDRRNDRGGIYRAGTGSAMFYLRMAEEIGASASGRRNGEPFAANYSVNLFTKTDGPFSLIRSMTTPDLKLACNGGPLTLELHSSVFASEDATKVVGALVRQFILLGGHQLQLNAVNSDVLKDAQKHPEAYPSLIVRIWGWSAYFTELDKEYQDHVIARQEYTV